MNKIELFNKNGESRGFYSQKNRVNDLTGKEWLFWTRSVITKSYPPNLQHKLRNQHGGQKPPQLCADLIKIFTKKGQTILDPFMGVGGVLLGAALCSRVATGIEIESKWIEIYKEVCRLEKIKELETICGDSLKIIPGFKKRVFDFILTDVPYWKMDRAPRSKGKFKKYGIPAEDPLLSSLSVFNKIEYSSKNEWLVNMKKVFELSVQYLKNHGYLLCFIGDMYFNDEYHCLSAELAQELKKIQELKWKANIIWYDVSKKLHLYGYQYTFIPSMIHQNILIFKKQI